MAKEELLKGLTALGCDIEGAMERTLNDTDFYIDCLNRCLDDDAFRALGHAIAENQTRAAFEQAHSLKGVTGMLGLTSIYALASAMTESLRGGSMAGVAKEYADLEQKRMDIDALMRACGVRGEAQT